MTDSRAPHESGFTLIELLVAMVVFAIAFAIAGQLLIQAFQGSGAATSGTLSESMVRRASALFTEDFARAETLQRAQGATREQNDLNDAVRTGAQLMSTDPTAPGVVDIDDVVQATPTVVQVRANVDRDAVVECVTWTATAPGSTYLLTRSIADTCGATGTSEVVLRASAASPDVNTRPFTYVLQCHPSDCPGSAATSAKPCMTWTSTNVTGVQRRWIVGIRVQLTAVAQAGKSVSAGSGSANVTIRSRDTQMWRTALGC